MRKKNKVRRARSEYAVKQAQIIQLPSVPSSASALSDKELYEIKTFNCNNNNNSTIVKNSELLSPADQTVAVYRIESGEIKQLGDNQSYHS